MIELDAALATDALFFPDTNANPTDAESPEIKGAQ
jgi:hypothetical protein